MEDLSHLCKGLLAGSSMSAGNTISETPAGAASGSPSEQTEDVATHSVPEIG